MEHRRHINWARCALLKPGFNAKLAEPIICGFIYDAACGHCGAKLFKGETVPVQEARRPSCVASKHCCSDGGVTSRCKMLRC